MLEIVSTRTSFKRREGNVSELQWRYVAVFAGAKCTRFIIAFLNREGIGQAVSASTGGTVELIRAPRTILRDSFVDRKRLRSGRVKYDANVSDVERFACDKREKTKVSALCGNITAKLLT